MAAMPRFPHPKTPDRQPPDASPGRKLPLRTHLPALAVGALLALACWGMATHGDPRAATAGYAGMLAAVMVAAGAASFVLHALHTQARRRTLRAAEAGTVARSLILLLGLSFSGTLHLLNLALSG